MYIITKPGAGVQRIVVAAFSLLDGRIVFDVTRGDPEVIESLRAVGVASTENGITTLVKPENGQKFLDACLKSFSSTHLSCSDESALEALRRRFPAPDRKRTSIPPSAA